MNWSELTLNHCLKRAAFEGWEVAERCITDYELVLVIKGYGNVMIDGQEFVVEAGDLLCFKPGIRHSLWLSVQPYMVFYGIHFSLPAGMEDLPFPGLLHLDAPMRLEKLFRSMYEIYGQKGYMQEWRLNLLAQQILCEIFLILDTQKEPMGVARVKKVLEYIQENLYRQISLEELVRHAGIGKTLFLRSFREVTGTTPTQYVTGMRLENARDLLTETDLPISLIAEKCGFEDPFYFSRCFKKKYARSPRQYRGAGKE